MSWSSADSIFCRFTGDTDIIRSGRGGLAPPIRSPACPEGSRPARAPAARSRPIPAACGEGRGAPPARHQSQPSREAASQSEAWKGQDGRGRAEPGRKKVPDWVVWRLVRVGGVVTMATGDADAPGRHCAGAGSGQRGPLGSRSSGGLGPRGPFCPKELPWGFPAAGHGARAAPRTSAPRGLAVRRLRR